MRLIHYCCALCIDSVLCWFFFFESKSRFVVIQDNHLFSLCDESNCSKCSLKFPATKLQSHEWMQRMALSHNGSLPRHHYICIVAIAKGNMKITNYANFQLVLIFIIEMRVFLFCFFDFKFEIVSEKGTTTIATFSEAQCTLTRHASG